MLKLKNSTAIGYTIRMAMNSQWYLVNVLGRTVAVRRITKSDTNFTSCEDCRKDSTVLVVELSRFTSEGKRNKHPLVWGWCGSCDIGES